jgi:hypothetical protein
LFPSNWLTLKGNTHVLKAQEYATRLVKLNTMQLAEGLSYSLGRSQHLWNQLKADRELHREVEVEVEALENAGKLQPGSHLAIRSAGNNLDQTVATLESLIPLETTLLTHTVGFINPDAIEELKVETLGDIHAPPELDVTSLSKKAIEVALETRQVEELLTASKISRFNRGFQWVSPSGDPHGAFGLGIPTYIEIGSSAIRDLHTTRHQLHSALLRKIMDVYNDYYKSLDSFQFAEKGVAIQTARIELARSALRNATLHSVHDLLNLQDALQLLSVNHANLLSAEYEWYISISRMNRLLLLGAYSE